MSRSIEGSTHGSTGECSQINEAVTPTIDDHRRDRCNAPP
jgi:hypothetical protein